VRDPRELGGAWTRFQDHGSAAPPADLAPFVAGFWTAAWDYEQPYRQPIAPEPHVHVTIRPGRGVEVHGVSRHHVTRVLEGRDSVVGARFRPGAFRAFLGAPVATLTGRTVPADSLPALAGAPPRDADVGSLEAWLRSRLPGPTPAPGGRRAIEAVELAASTPAIRRVDDLADAVGTGVRSLQRLFAEHVGIGPKWVIRRYRLAEVTDRLSTGGAVDWARLAAELGYADQPHLIRDFRDFFGEPPEYHARRYPRRR
jgi:AraC-like DNA-binding protein